MEQKNDYASDDAGVISRFTLAILGCLAIGVGIGTQMSENYSGLAVFGGVLSLLFYYYQSLRATRRQLRQSESCRIAAEERLAMHVNANETSRSRSGQSSDSVVSPMQYSGTP